VSSANSVASLVGYAAPVKAARKSRWRRINPFERTLMDAITITPAGDIAVVDLTAGGRSTADGTRAEIGCRYFDVVTLTLPATMGTVDMWVDDEGMGVEPVNVVATLVAKALKPNVAQYYHGTALFASSNKEGDTIGLGEESLAMLRGIAERAQALVARKESEKSASV
jgi:hypothetical protein